jgi:hypothetical protein
MGNQSRMQHGHCRWFPPPHIKMPVASKANLIVASMNDILRILTENFHGTVDPLTDGDVHALAQMTSLLHHHADASPIAPVPDSLLRVPAPALELRVPLETYHNRAKPLNHHEPHLPSTSLHRSPCNHPLTLQANSAALSALRSYHTHVDEYAMRCSMPTQSALPTQSASPTIPGQHHASCPWHYHIGPSQRNAGNSQSLPALPRLRSH